MVNKIDKKYKEYFDTIFLLEVLEYIWNPIQCFENINQLLKPNGILYLSTHFIYPVHNPVEDDCLRYTRTGAMKLLKKAGFELKSFVPRYFQAKLEYDSFISKEAMRPAKNYSCHNESGILIKARKI